ncbi:cysteine--tRNA ligase [Patescibacteria group bacterium]|nr:cysteine--tRNA ligase [Patescibacteria group bacterium]
MALKLYNTLSRQKEEFKPLKENHVKMYVCGPTVYNYVTIANFRGYIIPDILRRYFEYHGYKIKHVMNLTDVDDKTIRVSQEQKISLAEYTQKYSDAFLEDANKLNIIPPTKICKATDHIKEMIKIIKYLLKKNIAYQGKDGSIYFSILKFEEYGKLAKLDKTGLKIGHRVSHQEYDKDQAADFVLWKAHTQADGENFWKSPFGPGRPGWSIECSAMSMKYLGETFDIHTGGVDLIFPHHENEIAQSECYTGKKFVNYWIHHEHILVNGQRMGKSLKNFYTVRDILDKNYSPRDLRYLYLSSHYRSKLNFTWDSIKAAHNVLKNIDNFITRLQNVKKEMPNIPANSYESLFTSSQNQFFEAVEDDLNTPKAISVLHNLIKKINILLDDEKIGKKAAQKTIELLKDFDRILAVLFVETYKIPAKITALVQKREKARDNKDFRLADKIRQEITKAGYAVEDTATGPQIFIN